MVEILPDLEDLYLDVALVDLPTRIPRLPKELSVAREDSVEIRIQVGLQAESTVLGPRMAC